MQQAAVLPEPASLARMLAGLPVLTGGSITPLAAAETGLGDAIRDPDFQW